MTPTPISLRGAVLKAEQGQGLVVATLWHGKRSMGAQGSAESLPSLETTGVW